jgi:purine-binding chemotaxis protein CheW
MGQSNVATSNSIANSTPKSASPELAIRELLAFKLGDEEYGMDILRVQEIRFFERSTRMANAPTCILGVVNLRGVIVPIFDMRIKFNLAQVNYDTFTVVIVLNIGKQVVGMVVDGVSDVITLKPEQLRPVPGARVLLNRRQRPSAGHRLAGKLHTDSARYRKTLKKQNFLHPEMLAGVGLDEQTQSRRISAAGRFAEVKEEVAALGCAGGHGAKRPAALIPRARCFFANAGRRQGPELLMTSAEIGLVAQTLH